MVARRPRDVGEARVFVQRAHDDMRGRVDPVQTPHYARFWAAVDVLVGTTLFQDMPGLFAENSLAHVVINCGTPVFVTTMREPDAFEVQARKQAQHRKHARRCDKFAAFAAELVRVCGLCLLRADVQADLRTVATECQRAFSDPVVLEGLQVLYATMKNFRRIVRLMAARLAPTFLVCTALSSTVAMRMDEMHDLVDLL